MEIPIQFRLLLFWKSIFNEQHNPPQIKISKEANNLDKVKIFNYALSDTKDEKKFWVTDLRKKSGFSLLDDEDLEREAKLNKYDYNKLFFKKIKTEIFDKEFTIKNKLIFVKIDVERHEFQVLLGAINFFTKSNNKIFLQIEIVDHLKRIGLPHYDKRIHSNKIYNLMQADKKNTDKKKGK